MAAVKRVAIVGAGAAGLCSARNLVQYPAKKCRLEPVVFEKASCIGGTWVYQDVPKDGDEVHSSLYCNLRTNLPKEVMLVPGFPFPENESSFMHHSVVRQYLENFAAFYGLNKYVHLNHEVTSIKPLGSVIGSSRWEVQIHNLCTDGYITEQFDAVVVCNGHYSMPHYPVIKGIKNFRGRFMHSHYYRDPAEFSGLRVAVFGCGPSGFDIALGLSEVCSRVILSHYSEPLQSPLPENVVEKCSVAEVNSDGHLCFLDGSAEPVDVFMACTGYEFHFPFLSPECNVEVKKKRVMGLYKHIFHISSPTLAFVGLPWTVAPFPLFHAQSLLVASVLSEDVVLPRAPQMLEDTEKEWKKREIRGSKPEHFHKMDMEQFPYVREILEIANCEQNPRIIEEIYSRTTLLRRKNLLTYKNLSFKVLDDGEVVVVENNVEEK